jgi:hypothetical protein
MDDTRHHLDTGDVVTFSSLQVSYTALITDTVSLQLQAKLAWHRSKCNADVLVGYEATTATTSHSAGW